MNNKKHDIKTMKINHRCGCTIYVKIKKEVINTDIFKQCFDTYELIREQNGFYCISCGAWIFTLEKVCKILITKE